MLPKDSSVVISSHLQSYKEPVFQAENTKLDNLETIKIDCLEVNDQGQNIEQASKSLLKTINKVSTSKKM